MFSLEEISKIKNAKTSKEVLQFFKVLDKYIPDNFQESNQNLSQDTNNTLMNNQIRKDEIQDTEIEGIQKNFPETDGKYLKV